jgi:hypothetical protein
MTDSPGERAQDDVPGPFGLPGDVDPAEVEEVTTGARTVFGANADRRISGVVAMWSTCTVITIGGYQLLAQGRSPINVVFILILLGLLAGTSLIGPSVGMLTLLTLGVLLAWPLPIGWLLSILPPDLSAASHDVNWIGGLTVLLVALVVAIWRRPPPRRPDGTSIVATRLVNWLALLCVVGGPVVGFAAFEALTPGDIYGRLLVLGLAVGLFGLALSGGYSAFLVLTGRPGQAAILAVAYPVLLLSLALMGPRWTTTRPPMAEVIVETTLDDGRLVRASRASPAGPPAYALDGRADSAWNAGTFAPAWIEIDLGAPATITGVRLLVSQSPAGETIHEVIGISPTGIVRPITDFRGVTRDGDWLTHVLTTPALDIQVVRVATRVSPSWVAWREIDIDVGQP